jgi:hypothetical protein
MRIKLKGLTGVEMESARQAKKETIMKRLIIGGMMIITLSAAALAEESQRHIFVGYEILEMAMNNFKNFAGEIGYRLDGRNTIRLSIMEVNLTERHLSSNYEAMAIDGENVTGYFRGYEASLDRYFSDRFYASASLGYFSDTYEHTILDERLKIETMTLGTGIGYRRFDMLGIKGAYLHFSIPIRFYFNKIDETRLGETTVREHLIVNNIWLFLGYEFD